MMGNRHPHPTLPQSLAHPVEPGAWNVILRSAQDNGRLAASGRHMRTRLMLTIIAVSVLAGCGRDDSSPGQGSAPTDGSQAPKQPETVTIHWRGIDTGYQGESKSVK